MTIIIIIITSFSMLGYGMLCNDMVQHIAIRVPWINEIEENGNESSNSFFQKLLGEGFFISFSFVKNNFDFYRKLRHTRLWATATSRNTITLHYETNVCVYIYIYT